MKVLVYGIEKNIIEAERKAKYLIDTAKCFDINFEFVGIGHEYTGFKNRLYLLQDYLKKIDSNEIVLIMDGYDTLFCNKIFEAEKIFLEKKTKIFISAEKIFTYQYGTHRDKYDIINSPYRYVNAGTYMGYNEYIQKMINSMLVCPSGATIDQGLMGIWVYENFENEELVKLDTNCEIFWVASGDWHDMKNLDTVYNINTKTYPIIVHNTGNSDKTLYETYEHIYNTIINNHIFIKNK